MKEKNKKILITSGIFYPEIGGPASYAALLAKNLSENSNKVTILTYSSVLSEKTDRDLSYRVIRVWSRWPKIFKHIIYFMKLMFLSGGVDTIFALNAVSAGWPAMLSAKLFKKRFLVRIAGDYAWEIAVNKAKTHMLINDFQKSSKKGWISILHKLQVSTCKRSECVVVPSEYLANLVSEWGVDRKKIKVIYNGVDFKAADISREDARKKIGIPGNIIISVGRLVPWKGFRMLIKIMPQLLEMNQFTRLVIVGDGPEFKSLQAMVRNLGLDRKVYLVGKKNKNDLRIYMAAADIFILNTGYEGFSHQVLEAMSVGLPVITTAVGGNKEVVTQGENGFLIKYNDEFNLIEAIKTLWETPSIKERFAEEGKKTVMRFSPGKMVDETTRLLIL